MIDGVGTTARTGRLSRPAEADPGRVVTVADQVGFVCNELGGRVEELSRLWRLRRTASAEDARDLVPIGTGGGANRQHRGDGGTGDAGSGLGCETAIESHAATPAGIAEALGPGPIVDAAVDGRARQAAPE